MLRYGAFQVKDPQAGLLHGFRSVQMGSTTMETCYLGVVTVAVCV